MTTPTLHILERPPKRTRMGPLNSSRFVVAPQKDKDGTPPQPFTFWSGPPKGQGWHPPTLHDLAADFLLPNSAYKICHSPEAVGRSRGSPFLAPKRTRIGPPEPFTTWSGSPKGQGWDTPPNPSRLGVAFQKDKDVTTPTFHILERPPKRTRMGPPQPFTFWSGPPTGQGWDPPTLSRFGGCSFPGS